MVLSGARPKGAWQATGRGPGSADADPHDAYRPGGHAMMRIKWRAIAFSCYHLLGCILAVMLEMGGSLSLSTMRRLPRP